MLLIVVDVYVFINDPALRRFNSVKGILAPMYRRVELLTGQNSRQILFMLQAVFGQWN
jgi:hypothetical protein